MNRYMKRWISLLLAACLLLALSTAALTEEAVDGETAAEAVEAMEAVEAAGDAEANEGIAEAPAEDAGATEAEPAAETESVMAEPVTAATVDAAVLEAEAVDLDALEAEDDLAAGDTGVESIAEDNGLTDENAPVKPYAYAWTVSDASPVYRDDALSEPLYTLRSGEAVLIVERLDGAVLAAFNSMEGAVKGYMRAEDVAEMSQEDARRLLNEMAVIGAVALYEDDIDWPLPLAVRELNLAAADFTRQSNDKEFVVQGKTITARMVGDHSDCWSWARALYYIIWGVKFDNNFIGEASTGISLIRNLTDEERQLTGENLKHFMAQSVPGCTLRICSCPRNCSNIDNDGCPKHEKHSLIVVEIGEDGFVVMDNVTGNGSDRYDTRYYTYDNFAKHWAKYKMVKYIKWPNAPEYDKTKALAEAGVKPESVTLAETSIIIRAESSQPLVATVLPENAGDRSVTWSSTDPFVAYVDGTGNLVGVSKGKTTITATTCNGLTASAEVGVVDKNYKAKSVSLDQSGTVYLNLGETLQLNASVSPAYANPAVSWKSSKKKVATVSSTGLVTPKKAGTTTIVVKTASKKKAKLKVKVLKSGSAGNVTLNQTGTVTLNVGDTLQLSATVTPASSSTALKWKSSKKKVATVSADGLVTAKKAGTTTVAVMTANKKVARVKVKVEDANAPTAVALDKTGTVTLPLGQTLQLTATLAPATAQTSLKWKSSKKKVATVSSTGLVTPKKAGTTTVAVMTANKKIAKVKIKVTK